MLPIVGMGGVSTGRDALELIACGANDVALGTVLFGDPDAPQRVRGELDDALRDAGHATIDEAFCVAHDTVVSSVN
jgi:dihydroorotate dehydrogenase (NAD+) catalytic subunit